MENPPIDRLEAELTLFSLRGIMRLKTGTRASTFSVNGDTAKVSFAEASEILEKLPKSVECDAEARQELLVVTCVPMPEADKKEWEEWADNSLARQIAALRRVDTLFSRAAPKAFAIEAAGERMVVSTADFRTWRRDYRLRVDHSETFCQAGDEARSLGADAVMRLDRASDVHVEFR